MDKYPWWNPSPHTRAATRQSRAAGKAGKAVTKKGKGQSRLPTDIRQLAMMQVHIRKQLKGQDFDRNMSLRVLRVALMKQKEYLKARKKRGTDKGSTVSKPAIREVVCKEFGISPHTYGNILGLYLEKKQIYVSGAQGEGRSGNSSQKQSRIP